MTGDWPELADGELTAQLTEALRPLFPHASPSNGLVTSCKPGPCWCGADERLQRALPMVRRYGDQRAAETWDAAALDVKDVQRTGRPYDVADSLKRKFHTRAAALRGEADRDR
jgi:hypothetical protein